MEKRQLGISGPSASLRTGLAVAIQYQPQSQSRRGYGRRAVTRNATVSWAQHDDVVPYGLGHKLGTISSYDAITRHLHCPSRVDMPSNASKSPILLLSLSVWFLQ